MVEFDYAQSDERIADESVNSDKLEHHHRAIVEILKRHRILKDVFEVGTGIGNLCAYLLRDGITCSGIELSPKLVEIAQKRGLPIIKKDMYEITNAESFSALIMSNVFEHLCDPARALTHINELLKPRGLFITDQPTAGMTNLLSRAIRLNRLNADSRLRLSYFNLQQWHMVIYSIKGMVTLAAKHGFELIEFMPMPSLKEKGLLGVVRKAYQTFNTMGEWLLPKRWPFHVNYLFVFQKK